MNSTSHPLSSFSPFLTATPSLRLSCLSSQQGVSSPSLLSPSCKVPRGCQVSSQRQEALSIDHLSILSTERRVTAMYFCQVSSQRQESTQAPVSSLTFQDQLPKLPVPSLKVCHPCIKKRSYQLNILTGHTAKASPQCEATGKRRTV